MRKFLLDGASFFGGEELIFCTLATEVPRRKLNYQVLNRHPPSLMNPWHLEAFVGFRDPSKQLLAIVAFDSEL